LGPDPCSRGTGIPKSVGAAPGEEGAKRWRLGYRPTGSQTAPAEEPYQCPGDLPQAQILQECRRTESGRLSPQQAAEPYRPTGIGRERIFHSRSCGFATPRRHEIGRLIKNFVLFSEQIPCRYAPSKVACKPCVSSRGARMAHPVIPRSGATRNLLLR